LWQVHMCCCSLLVCWWFCVESVAQILPVVWCRLVGGSLHGVVLVGFALMPTFLPPGVVATPLSGLSPGSWCACCGDLPPASQCLVLVACGVSLSALHALGPLSGVTAGVVPCIRTHQVVLMCRCGVVFLLCCLGVCLGRGCGVHWRPLWVVGASPRWCLCVGVPPQHCMPIGLPLAASRLSVAWSPDYQSVCPRRPTGLCVPIAPLARVFPASW
jgi:hypothetical protein